MTVRLQRLQAIVDQFNERHPVGSAVQFWTGTMHDDPRSGAIRAPAELLSGHTPVVWIEGARGCVALSHVRALPEPVQ